LAIQVSIQGVTQTVNKLGGTFTEQNEEVIKLFDVFVGTTTKNAMSYQASIDLVSEFTSKPRFEAVLCQPQKVVQAGHAMVFALQGTGIHDDMPGLEEVIEA
jgi:hypothetical protein